MQLRRSFARLIAGATIALAVPALSSCGFDHPTEAIYTPAAGVNDRDASVDVLHAVIVSSADGSGTFIAGLVNNDDGTDDQLTDVAGSDAEEDTTFELAGPVVVPSDTLVQLADDGGIKVEGERVAAGNFVELTLTFANAGTVTLEAPVVPDSGAFEGIDGEGSSTPTEG